MCARALSCSWNWGEATPVRRVRERNIVPQLVARSWASCACRLASWLASAPSQLMRMVTWSCSWRPGLLWRSAVQTEERHLQSGARVMCCLCAGVFGVLGPMTNLHCLDNREPEAKCLAEPEEALAMQGAVCDGCMQVSLERCGGARRVRPIHASIAHAVLSLGSHDATTHLSTVEAWPPNCAETRLQRSPCTWKWVAPAQRPTPSGFAPHYGAELSTATQKSRYHFAH